MLRRLRQPLPAQETEMLAAVGLRPLRYPAKCWTYTGANVELGSGSTTDGELPKIGSAAESGTSALVS